MSAVDIYKSVIVLYPAQANTFPSEPIPMMDFVNVSVQRPLVEENIFYWPFGKHTEAWTQDTAKSYKQKLST